MISIKLNSNYSLIGLLKEIAISETYKQLVNRTNSVKGSRNYLTVNKHMSSSMFRNKVTD